MRLRNTNDVVAILLLALALAGCGAESISTPPVDPTPAPTPRPADTFTLASSIVGDSYQVYVQTPREYAADAGARYPVLYLLDANWNFAPVRGVVDDLVSQGSMEPVIVVGVCPIQALENGYGGTAPARCRDLTPTALPDFPGSGHAEDFAGFLRSELIPRIDATYRTRPTADDRCLAGHSLAGLFAWYAAFHLDDRIHKLIPASASLWWDDHVLFAHEAAYARDHVDLPLQVYSTVSTGEGADMVGDRDAFVSLLRGRSYPSLRILTATYVGIEHNQSSGPAFREGLAELF